MQILPVLQRRGSFGVAVKELKLSYHILGTWQIIGVPCYSNILEVPEQQPKFSQNCGGTR